MYRQYRQRHLPDASLPTHPSTHLVPVHGGHGEEEARWKVVSVSLQQSLQDTHLR